jgi:hypothetical protein
VTGPAPAGGGDSVGGEPVDEASPEALLESDEVDGEVAPPEAPLEGDGEAAPESKLEGEAEPPEAELEGDEWAQAQRPGQADDGMEGRWRVKGDRHLFLCKRKAVLIKVNVPGCEHPV